ncbi:hypothetical protein E2C01_056408 [Portunus trituberculatus]|uniref:Uncharacterized protein n=1 Tax=Portunus trituberculatus TaxID=210409 RepID=A0A5B7H0G2_PORTR|nr:hypothetical protein [Portunus trituberculatus]
MQGLPSPNVTLLYLLRFLPPTCSPLHLSTFSPLLSPLTSSPLHFPHHVPTPVPPHHVLPTTSHPLRSPPTSSSLHPSTFSSLRPPHTSSPLHFPHHVPHQFFPTMFSPPLPPHQSHPLRPPYHVLPFLAAGQQRHGVTRLRDTTSPAACYFLTVLFLVYLTFFSLEPLTSGTSQGSW